MIADVERNKGPKAFSLKKISYSKKERRRDSVVPYFPSGTKKAVALLYQWLKDDVIPLPGV